MSAMPASDQAIKRTEFVRVVSSLVQWIDKLDIFSAIMEASIITAVFGTVFLFAGLLSPLVAGSIIYIGAGFAAISYATRMRYKVQFTRSLRRLFSEPLAKSGEYDELLYRLKQELAVSVGRSEERLIEREKKLSEIERQNLQLREQLERVERSLSITRNRLAHYTQKERKGE
jgi:hypothetical protein